MNDSARPSHQKYKNSYRKKGKIKKEVKKQTRGLMPAGAAKSSSYASREVLLAKLELIPHLVCSKTPYSNILGCSASRGMRQTFSCLSKLGRTTNLIRLLFGHVK